jgi:hypothetical protein
MEARLAERGRLLVAGVGGERDLRPKQGGVGSAVNLGGGADLREQGGWYPKVVEDFRIPTEGVNVEEECARGVGYIGDVESPS